MFSQTAFSPLKLFLGSVIQSNSVPKSPFCLKLLFHDHFMLANKAISESVLQEVLSIKDHVSGDFPSGKIVSSTTRRILENSFAVGGLSRVENSFQRSCNYLIKPTAGPLPPAIPPHQETPFSPAFPAPTSDLSGDYFECPSLLHPVCCFSGASRRPGFFNGHI